MKKILCFGDSNTFGFNPENGLRYDINTRWSGILKTKFNGVYDVIEAGCNNRTCFFDNPDGLNQTGYKILPSLLKNNADLIIFALGINDLQKQYSPDFDEFSSGLSAVLDTIYNKLPNVKVILVSPSAIRENILNSYFACLFDKNSIKKSLKLAEIYEKAAEEKHCIFVDFDKIAQTSSIDGLHYTKVGHKKIAEYLYNLILSINI